MSHDHLDRRAFLKLGATGTALAALRPAELSGLSAQASTPMRKGSLSCPPHLADLASDPLTYHFRDLFNCPTAMNEYGYAQVGKSVSAITAITFPPYACCGPPDTAWSPGYLLTCELFVDGEFAAIAAPPDGNVEYQWFPHCVTRKQTIRGLAVFHAHVSAKQAARSDADHHGKELVRVCSTRCAWFRHARSHGEEDHGVVRQQSR